MAGNSFMDVEIKHEGLDEATKLVAGLPGIFRHARKSALSSVGFAVRDEMSRLGKNGIVNLGWDKRNPHTPILNRVHLSRSGMRLKNWKTVWRGKKGSKRRGRLYWSDNSRGGSGKKHKSENPYGRMISGIRYEKPSALDDTVRIGFLGKTKHLRSLALILAKGQAISVTKKMRRFAFAMGFPLKAGTGTLKTPARPWAKPVMDKYQDEIMKVFAGKFWASFERQTIGNKTKHGPEYGFGWR